jgi:WD40 repeat protein
VKRAGCIPIAVLTLVGGCILTLVAAVLYLQHATAQMEPVVPPPATHLISMASLPADSYLAIGNGRVRMIAFSPDGATLAAATSLGVTFYDTDEFQPRLNLPTVLGADELVWSPDGRALAVAGGAVELMMLDAARGERTWQFDSRDRLPRNLDWSADGRYLAATVLGMYREDVWIWDAQTGERLFEIPDGVTRGNTYAREISWSPVDNRLAITYKHSGLGQPMGGREEIQVWQIDSEPRRLYQWPLSEYSASALDWTADGRSLVAGDFDGIHLVNPSDGYVLATTTLSGGTSDTMALSPSRSKLVVLESEERIALYGLPGLTKLDEFTVPDSNPDMLTWSSDDTLAGANSSNGEFFVWSVAERALLAQVSTGAYWVEHLAWSPDSTRLAAIAHDSRTRVYAADNGALLLTVGEVDPLFRPEVAWSPDGRVLATTREPQELGQMTYLWSDSGAPLGAIEGVLGAWSAASGWLTQLNDDVLQSWQISPPGQPRLVGERPLLDLDYFPSPTDEIYAQRRRTPDAVQTWFDWESIVIRRAEDESEVVELREPDMSHVRSVAWSPDGQWLAASYDKANESGHVTHSALTIWSTTTWQVVRSFDNLSGSSWTLSWSPDGQWVAATDAPTGFNVTLYPRSESRPILEIEGHNGAVESVAWSPDGRRLASSGYDGQVIIWDAAALLAAAPTAAEP